MMSIYLYNHLPHYEPEYARVFLEDVRLRCLAAARPDLAALCDKALVRVRAARDMELARETGRTYGGGSTRSSDIDAEVEHVNGLIWRMLTQAMEAGDLHPLSAAAAEVRAAAYPKGALGQARSTYVEKSDLYLRAADQLAQDSSRQVVEGLMLTAMVDRLAVLASTFDASLRSSAPLVTYQDVRAAITLANERVVRAVQGIASAFDADIPEELTLREHLLVPVRKANDEIHARNAARQPRRPPVCAPKDPPAGEAPAPAEGVPAEPISKAS